MQITPRRALVGWVMFDWAAQPFYTLVLTFLFAPYFASTFIGDAAWGQELWGYTTAAAGLIVAILSPVLGAIADASGKRKPWIAVSSILLIAGLCSLWLAAPGQTSLLVPVICGVIVASVAAEIATVFTNAMMPGLVPPHQLGRLSGTGWAVGYAGGLVSLVLTAGLLVADGETGKTMMGLNPVLPLNSLDHEGERLIGPFSALWYAVFILPLFMFTPDSGAGKSVNGPGSAVSRGLRQLRETLLHVRRYGNIVRFLVARMLYADGLGAIFVFGGLYAASLFGWTAQTDNVGGQGVQYTVFLQGSRPAAGCMGIPEEWGKVPSHWGVYFAVDDCDAMHQKAKGLGATETVPPQDIPEIGRFSMLSDPQGAAFSIIKLKNPQ